MARSKFFILCCSILFTAVGCTHPVKIEPNPSPIVVFKGVRVIDGKGGEPRENVSLIINGDRIERIQHSTSRFPFGAKVIDMSGKTIMPALIAAHSHLGLTRGDQAGAAQITEENVLHQLNKFQTYGVGSVVSMGSDHDFIFDLREKRRRYEVQSPTILTAGRGFGVHGGAPPRAMGMDEVYRPRTVDEVKKNVEDLYKYRPDLVKIWVDDFGHTIKEKMTPILYKTIIDEAHSRGLKVVAHVYYLADAKRLAAEGVDIFGHSVRDKAVDAEFISLMKKNNIAYIPTLALDDAFSVYAENPAFMHDEFFKRALDPSVWEWLHSPAYEAKDKSRKDLSIAKENVLALQKAGVRVGLGTDSGATLARIQGFAEHRELELLVEAGLTPMQAIVAGTSVNASIVGISGQRGTLEAGQKADLLVLNENPLVDILNTRKIDSVWLEGKRVSGGPTGK